MSHLGRGHHHKQQLVFNYFLQVELKVYCYANFTSAPSYLSIHCLRSNLGFHFMAQTASGKAFPPRCSYRLSQNVGTPMGSLLDGFHLWHLIFKAALHPSSHCCSTRTTSCCPCHLPALFIFYHDNFPRIRGLPSAQTQPPSGCYTTSLPPRAGAKPNKQNHFKLCPATHEY